MPVNEQQIRDLVIIPMTTLYRRPSTVETPERAQVFLESCVQAIADMGPTGEELSGAWLAFTKTWKFPVWPNPANICEAIRLYREEHRPAALPAPAQTAASAIEARRRRVFEHPLARDLLFGGAGKALCEEYIDPGHVPEGRHITPQIEARCRRIHADFLAQWEAVKTGADGPFKAALLGLADGMMAKNRDMIERYGG